MCSKWPRLTRKGPPASNRIIRETIHNRAGKLACLCNCVHTSPHKVVATTMFAGIFLSVRPLFRHVVESSSICCYRVSLISYTVFIWLPKVYEQASRIVLHLQRRFVLLPFFLKLLELFVPTASAVFHCSYSSSFHVISFKRYFLLICTPVLLSSIVALTLFLSFRTLLYLRILLILLFHGRQPAL